MEKISVIIPVYKVEPYLRQCLDSVIGQTYANLEIILIDDGSPDGCGRICDEYAACDERICVIHKENGGLSAARNDGIRISTGEWLTFVDSDDWLDLDYYEQLMAAPGLEFADIVCSGGYWLDFPNMHRRVTHCTVPRQATERNEIENMMACITTYGLPWDKLYRREFIERHHLCFDITSRAIEDYQFIFEVFDHARRITICTTVGYHYRQIEMSITKKFNPHKPDICYDVISKMHIYATEHQLSTLAVHGIDTAAICAIRDSLNIYFFHPANTSPPSLNAKAFRDMKKMPYYHEAIFSKDNTGYSRKQIILKYVLRLPWIWPVKMLCWGNHRNVVLWK